MTSHVVFAQRKLSYGGSERVLVEQVAALAEWPVEVTVVFRREPDKLDVIPEMRRRNPNIGEVVHLPSTLDAYRWLKANRPDLVVLCYHKGVARALRLLKLRGVRVPATATLHEHYPRHLAKYRSIRGQADFWICDYDFRDDVRRYLGPQPCTVIHPLYPHRSAEPVTADARRAARERLGIPAEARVVGYLGQVNRRKNPMAALRFAELLEEQLQQEDTPEAAIWFVVGGNADGSVDDDLTRAIDASPLADRVRHLGALDDLGATLAVLDLYVLTSRNEGFFPLSLIEAMEREIPVVAPTVGGIPTVLEEAEGAFLIQEPDDLGAVRDPALEEAARRVASSFASEERWAAQGRRARELMEELHRDYDPAELFRRAVAPFVGETGRQDPAGGPESIGTPAESS